MIQGPDIISIGEPLVELSCEGDMRLAPSFMRSFGGDTLNTAVAARRLGSSVTYVTRISSDPFGQALSAMLHEEGIGLSHPRPGKGGTGMYFVSVGKDGQREFFYQRKGSAASLLTPEDISEELIKSAKIVYASGISLAISDGCRQAVTRAFQLARQHGVMTAFDPNYREALWHSQSRAVDTVNELLPFVDIFMPSFPEDTQAMAGFSKPEQVIDHYLYKGLKLVVVKAGPRGAFVGYRKESEHVPGLQVTAIDTTGAGDAFNGGFLHGLVQDLSLVDCARLGNATAGLKVTSRGSAIAMPDKEKVYARVF